ncbi:hypothetical protein CVT25_014828 [Psilocybe cyanescens]|uniref:Uncharacterized protein n=1 Tax=Psilocybe cyanescens TaxID=93625 RepID=A0A409WEW9_PSICY|nr:hypothetical protein CVT25_014828 [Psilocybe cyanescens]
MLARITTATAHLVDVVDLQALRCLLPSTKDNLWGRVTACGRAVTLCLNLQQVLSSDFANVTQLLLDLEVRHEEPFHDLLVTLPIVIPSTHPSTPSIVITLAPSQPRETSCCIPYQNQAFGSLLPVPSHPVFNKSHPPMSLDSCILPSLDKWEWRNGRWEVVLPSLEEQNRRGMFSRAISSKRKSCRSPVCTGSQARHSK